jgi:hypothetical protein
MAILLISCSELAGHGLAAALAITGAIGIVVHILHRRARHGLHLTSPPGSIAAIVSLTSRSGFGDLLLPYDDVPSMRRKLDGLRFTLDRRTGAIIADESDNYDNAPPQRKPGVTRLRSAGSDDMRMSLLAPTTVTGAVVGAGQRHERTPTMVEDTYGQSTTSLGRASEPSRSPSPADRPVLGFQDLPYQWEPLPYPTSGVEKTDHHLS